jgi:hypothetical protein
LHIGDYGAWREGPHTKMTLWGVARVSVRKQERKVVKRSMTSDL